MPRFLSPVRPPAIRMQPAMSSFRGQGAVQSTSVSRSSQVPMGIVLGSGQPYRTSWNTDRAVREAYERVVWAYRAIDVISGTASRLTVGVREGNPRTGPWVDDPRIDRLFNRFANAWESAQSFRYRISGQLLLSKAGVFVEVVCDNNNRPVRLQLLPPDRTSPIPDRMRFISGFQVTRDDGGYDRLPVWDPHHPQSNSVIWIRKTNLVNPYLSSTPMEAAAIDVDTHYLGKLYNRSYLQNDGRPGSILAVQSRLSPEDAATLKAKFSGGVQGAGRMSIVEAPEMQLIDTSTTPRDVQYSQGMDLSKQAILAAFGVPESQAGDTSGRTFDNADADEENFWRVTMLSHLSILNSAFDQLTVGGWDDDFYVVHDLDDVFVLQREARTLADRLAADHAAGRISLDEYREGTGRPVLDIPASRTLWLPAGLVPVGGEPGDVETVLANTHPIAGAPAPTPPAPTVNVLPAGGAPGLPAAPVHAAIGASAGHVNPALSAANAAVNADNTADGTSLAQLAKSHKARRRALLAKAMPNTTTPPNSAAGSGVMVCLKPTDAVAAALAMDGGESPDQLHITLAYLGNTADLPASAHDDLLAAVHAAASAAPLALTGELSGTTRFKADDGDPSAFVALVDIPGLSAWRERLVSTINAEPDLSVSSDHGFTAHMTLSYLDPDDPMPSDELPDLPLRFRSVWVVWNDEWTQVAFGGGAKMRPFVPPRAGAQSQPLRRLHAVTSEMSEADSLPSRESATR